MTDDQATALPEGRYSQPGRRRSRVGSVIVVLAVTVGVGLAYLAFTNVTATPVEGRQTGYEVTDDSTLSLRFEVTRDDPSQAAVCIVRARSADGSESGRREVLVAPSEETIISVQTEVRTSARPVAGDVFGCTLTVPPWFSPA